MHPAWVQPTSRTPVEESITLETVPSPWQATASGPSSTVLARLLNRRDHLLRDGRHVHGVIAQHGRAALVT